jgi:hypothetical protein
MFEYIKDAYGVSAQLGQVVFLNDKQGVIAKDRGHYVGINFDSDKAGVISNVHPTDENLVYTDKIVGIRQMTRSQKRYQEFLNADTGVTFAEWIGIR